MNPKEFLSHTLVIAEKPSMARDIAAALAQMTGQRVTRNDVCDLCMQVGSISVIGAQGHLFSLASAEQYGSQFAFPWRVEPLPVLPDVFEIEPNFVKKLDKVVNNDLTKSIRKRLSQIETLIKSASRVVHAGDPDREGQLIIDDILRNFGFNGPVARLWLHAQTRDGIEDAWAKMKDNTAHGNLGVAAVARRESDWAIGINTTRAYTAIWWRKGNKGVLNVGRVVTPVVGMIVQRENEIREFKPLQHYSIKAELEFGAFPVFSANWVKPTGEPGNGFDASGKLLLDRDKVDAIRKKCHGKPARVVSADKTKKTEAQPLLLSLTELQKMAAKMGFSPDDTLAAAQSLYDEHKLTSYPRTDCQYAPESERIKVSAVFAAIENNFAGTWQPLGIDPSIKSRAWDDSKLAEHYAIIPLATHRSIDALKPIEKSVYRLICRQYLAQFLPLHEYEATALVFEIESEQFRTTGRVPLIEGWRTLYGGNAATKSTDPDSQDNLPNVKAGQAGQCVKTVLVESQTEAPKRFTAITMLEAMEKAYQFVTDPKVKAKLRQVEGIGTAATRAAVITKIVKSGFAEEGRIGKVISYAPTAKAFQYIRCVPGVLAKPDLTAWFEGKLEELANGSLDYARYRVMLGKLVDHTLADAKSGLAMANMPASADVSHLITASKSPRKKTSPVAPAKAKKS